MKFYGYLIVTAILSAVTINTSVAATVESKTHSNSSIGGAAKKAGAGMGSKANPKPATSSVSR